MKGFQNGAPKGGGLSGSRQEGIRLESDPAWTHLSILPVSFPRARYQLDRLTESSWWAHACGSDRWATVVPLGSIPRTHNKSKFQ